MDRSNPVSKHRNKFTMKKGNARNKTQQPTTDHGLNNLLVQQELQEESTSTHHFAKTCRLGFFLKITVGSYVSSVLESSVRRV